MMKTTRENLQKIAEILQLEAPNESAIESINSMIDQRYLFEERFFGENQYFEPYDDGNEESEYVLFFRENQGVHEIYLRKDELNQDDPKVYYSDGGIENVDPNGYSSFSAEILKIIEDFPNESAFDIEYIQEDNRDDFICRVCKKEANFADGDNIIEICFDCSEIYDIDQIWDDYNNGKIMMRDLNKCDLNSYKID